MSRLAGRARCAAPLAALTLAALSVAVPSAAASSSALPFHDANARGTLTFCNRANQPMTSGSLDTAPFAWKTVASAPAPAGYRHSDARATLYAYQPIQYVDPGDWSGGQLTGSSSFSNVESPVVQATNVDAALLGFTQAYPLHWDGLVEIRVYYTAFNKPPYSTYYPAAVLKVTGSRWTLVSGGGSSCTAGTGVSDESTLLPKRVLKKKHTVVPAGSPTPGQGQSSSPGGGSSTAPASSNGGGKTTAAGQSSNAADSSGLGSGAKAGIGLGVVALLGLGALGFMWWRRRPVSGP